MRTRAFTLIEVFILLILVVIIGIIIIFAIPERERAMRTARASEAKDVLSSVAESLWRYHTRTDSWPPQPKWFSYIDYKPVPSKYFRYVYSYKRGPADAVSVEITAIYLDIEEPPPRLSPDAIVYYSILFSTRPGVYPNGKRMDRTYYVYYYSADKKGAKYDWDGNLLEMSLDW